MADDPRPPKGIDVTVPSAARIHDYVLGGVHHYHVDRTAAEGVLKEFPELRDLAHASRAFLARTVRFLARQGVRQYLDLGSGLPTQENVHQIAQREAPSSRVAYIDNDPIVLAHGESLLTEDESTIYTEHDLRDVDAVVADTRKFFDFDQPIGLLCVSVLHYVPDDTDPPQVMTRYIDALPPGSWLALAHVTSDSPDQRAVRRAVETLRGAMHPRPTPDIAALFAGLPLVEPGLVPVERWRPDGHAQDLGPVWVLGGVACKRAS